MDSIQISFSNPGGCALFFTVLLLNLDNVNAKALLIGRVDLLKETERLFFVSRLRHDLSPRLNCQHIGKIVIDADRLDSHNTRRVSSLEPQYFPGLKMLDAVVSDTDLQSL